MVERAVHALVELISISFRGSQSPIPSRQQ